VHKKLYNQYLVKANSRATSRPALPSCITILSGPPALPTVLQYNCTTTGQYTTPLEPPFVLYTPYNPTWAIPDSVFIATLEFSESGIHVASATGKPLGFLWMHVQGFIKLARKNLDSGLFFFAAWNAYVGQPPPRYIFLRSGWLSSRATFHLYVNSILQYTIGSILSFFICSTDFFEFP